MTKQTDFFSKESCVLCAITGGGTVEDAAYFLWNHAREGSIPEMVRPSVLSWLEAQRNFEAIAAETLDQLRATGRAEQRGGKWFPTAPVQKKPKQGTLGF